MSFLKSIFYIFIAVAFIKPPYANIVQPLKFIEPLPATAITKIPIEANRWYILNHAPNGIASLFNGITIEKPNTGSAAFLSTYDCIYPLNDGEAISISQVRMFDYEGNFSANPVHLYAIKKDGRKLSLGTFTGSKFMQWVGPYPERNITGTSAFNLDAPVTDIRYIIISCTRSDLPTEVEFYGNYTPPSKNKTIAPRAYASFNKTLGMNAFSWDFVWPTTNTSARIIAEDKYAAIRNFSGFRHYLDWKQLEGAEGQYYFNPCYAGGWNCDAIYERCKRDGIEVLACIQNTPDWMKNTYPTAISASDNAPLKYGLPRDSVQSYIEKGKLAFQFTARYGRNTKLPLSLISVSQQPRWKNDPVNTVKVGLGFVKYIECGNELNKWWRGFNGYMNAYQYAALLSAFYDGHKGLLGKNVGVKNADSSMQVVMGGLASDDPSYVRAMVEWCRQNRGYKTNGKINLCWDVINYHHYSRDSEIAPTRGAAPELSNAIKAARSFVDFSEKYCNSMPVWITELGFDINQGSTQKAISIGNKSALQTQADWCLRSSLIYLREGISRLFFFELNDGNIYSSTRYASMGLTDLLFKRKPAMDYLYQTNQLLGLYHFKKSIQQLPVIDEYENKGKLIYAVWVPDEKGKTMPFSLSITSADSVIIYRPTIGSDHLQTETKATVNGKIELMATETPLFVAVKAREIIGKKK
jgi:hypothetical protein